MEKGFLVARVGMGVVEGVPEGNLGGAGIVLSLERWWLQECVHEMAQLYTHVLVLTSWL